MLRCSTRIGGISVGEKKTHWKENEASKNSKNLYYLNLLFFIRIHYFHHFASPKTSLFATSKRDVLKEKISSSLPINITLYIYIVSTIS